MKKIIAVQIIGICLWSSAFADLKQMKPFPIGKDVPLPPSPRIGSTELAQEQASHYATCFAPDQACDMKLLSFISGATTSLDIAIYDLNLPAVEDKIEQLSKKIPVRVVCDKMQAAGSHSLIKKLAKAGVKVRYGHQRGIMHNKFTLVDGNRGETGSFNYTGHATVANQENQLYFDDTATVEAYKTRFEKIWSTAVPVK